MRQLDLGMVVEGGQIQDLRRSNPGSREKFDKPRCWKGFGENGQGKTRFITGELLHCEIKKLKINGFLSLEIGFGFCP